MIGLILKMLIFYKKLENYDLLIYLLGNGKRVLILQKFKSISLKQYMY